MKRFIYAFAILFILTGCASKDDDPDILIITGFRGASEEAVSEAIEDSNLTIDSKIDCQGYTGYMGKFQLRQRYNPDTKTWEDPPAKYSLILTGSSYSMGYQAGYLMADQVFEMADGFMQALLDLNLSVMGVDTPTENDISYDPEDKTKPNNDLSQIPVGTWKQILEYRFITKNSIEDNDYIKAVDRELNSGRIPQKFIEEMRGIAEGATRRLSEDGDCKNFGREVYLWQIFVLNQTYETLLLQTTSQIMYDYVGTSTINTYDKDWKIKLGLPVMKGTSFVLSDGITKNGDTMHGRDFMFENGGIWQKANCNIMRLPADGRIPTIATTPAALIGFPDGMNRYGLSMDFNMVFGDAAHNSTSMSGMLITRDILEHSNNINSAIKRFRATRRSSTWSYTLADDDMHPAHGYSAVLESGRNIPEDPETGFDAVFQLNPKYWDSIGNVMREKLWNDVNIKYLPYEDSESARQLTPGPGHNGKVEFVIKDGVMVRDAAWIFPEKGFESSRKAADYTNNTEPGTEKNWYGRYDFPVWDFSNQIETKPNLIISTNHYIIPRMQLLTWNPTLAFTIGTGPLQESEWRYEMTTKLAAAAETKHNQEIPFFGNYETPVYGSAGWICNMLNPGHQNPDMVISGINTVKDWGKFGTQTNHYYTQHGEDITDIYIKNENTKDKDHYYIDEEDNETPNLLATNPAGSPMDGHHVVYNNSTRQVCTLFGHMNDDWVKINFADLTEIFYY